MPPTTPAWPGDDALRALAFAATTTGILVTDPTLPDNPIVDANPAFERLTGYARAEVLGRNCRFLQGQGTDPASVARLRDAVAEAQEAAEILLNYRKDGTPFWNELRISPVRDPAGRLTHFVGVQADVSAGRRSEATLRASDTRHRALLERLPALVFVQPADDPERAIYVNPRTLPLFGLSPEEWAATWQDRLHPADRPRVEAEVRRTAETGEPFAVEYRERAADGRWLWVRDEAVLVGDDGPAYWLGVKQDVTERKAAEKELVAAKEAAEEANRLKSAFLSTMSHELRNPLTAITGYAELLRDPRGDPLTPQQAADVAQIVASADHLLALIDDVLDLSRIGAGGLDLDLEEVALVAAVEEVRAALAPRAAAKGLALRVAVPPGLAARADPLRLRQILLNLAGNAVKFTERGGVTISAWEVGAWVEISVEDTGPGIAPETLPTIFDEFRQADAGTTRRYGGSGLGLAISRQLAALHGGAISVESEPGTGSTFTLRLPRAG